MCIFLSVARKLLCAIDCTNYWTPKKWFVSLVKDTKNSWKKIHLKPAQLPEKSSSPLGPTTGVARIQRPAHPQRMRITWQNCQVDLWIHMVHHPTVKYRVCNIRSRSLPNGWKMKAEKPSLVWIKMFAPPTWWVQRSTALAIFQSSSEGLISSTQVIEMVGWLDTLLWPRDVDLWFIIIHT